MDLNCLNLIEIIIWSLIQMLSTLMTTLPSHVYYTKQTNFPLQLLPHSLTFHNSHDDYETTTKYPFQIIEFNLKHKNTIPGEIEIKVELVPNGIIQTANTKSDSWPIQFARTNCIKTRSHLKQKFIRRWTTKWTMKNESSTVLRSHRGEFSRGSLAA